MPIDVVLINTALTRDTTRYEISWRCWKCNNLTCPIEKVESSIIDGIDWNRVIIHSVGQSVLDIGNDAGVLWSDYRNVRSGGTWTKLQLEIQRLLLIFFSLRLQAQWAKCLALYHLTPYSVSLRKLSYNDNYWERSLQPNWSGFGETKVTPNREDVVLSPHIYVYWLYEIVSSSWWATYWSEDWLHSCRYVEIWSSITRLGFHEK